MGCIALPPIFLHVVDGVLYLDVERLDWHSCDGGHASLSAKTNAVGDVYHHNRTMHFYAHGSHTGELSTLMTHMILNRVCKHVLKA